MATPAFLTGEYVIPDHVTAVRNHAFFECAGLTKVVIHDAVTSMGSSAFRNCTALKEVILGNGLSTIEYATFNYCSALAGITVPPSVTHIGIDAFANCSALAEIALFNSLTEIASAAFENCTALTDVYFIGTEGRRKEMKIPIDRNKPLHNARWHYLPDGTKRPPVEVLPLINGTCESNLYWAPPGATVSPDAAHSGKNGMRLRGSGNMGLLLGQDVVAEAGREYKLILWCKVKSVGVNVEVLDDDTRERLGGTWMDQTEWTCVEVPFTATSNRIDICFYGNGTSDLVEAYVDDIVVQALPIPTDDLFSEEVLHSVTHTDATGAGLAFSFKLDAVGVALNRQYQFVNTQATVTYLGKECRLLRMGAVVTNVAVVGESASFFKLDQVDDAAVVDVEATYLYKVENNYCAYAVRVIHIPETALDRTIYARPYCVIEVDGEEVTVYGDIAAASYAQFAA